MSALAWLSGPWVQPLGWTLVQFLWQGTVLALGFALVRAALARVLSAHGRYLLACGTLTLMTVAPLLTYIAGSELTRAAAGRWLAPVAMTSGAVMPALVAAWLCGVLVLSVRLLGGWLSTRRLRSTGITAPAPEWQHTFDRLARRLRVPRGVQLLVSAVVDVPVVVGWLRPIVLVPIGAFTGLPPDYVTALLAHELAHVRRRDYLVNLLQRVSEALLFYHPAVWWVSGQIRIEREMCCDDVAVALEGDPISYARALAELDACRVRTPRMELAANGTSLLDRIRRLLGQTTSAWHLMPGPGALAGLVILWFVGLAVVSAHGRPSNEATAPGTPVTRRVAQPPDRTSALLAAALLGPVGPVQQAPTGTVRPGLPSAAAPVVPATPDRFATGTASIRGRVLRLDTGTPVKRARVTLRRSGLADPPASLTDDEGRYLLTGLPPGRFSVVATKGGFVALEYGQRGPKDSGRPIELRDGQAVSGIDLALPAGAVMSGQVLDEAGQPQGGVMVRALEQQYVDGSPVPGPEVGVADVTDDLGQFRLFGLPAGDYFVGAVIGDPRVSSIIRFSSLSGSSQTKTFYPGTTRAREARPVHVNAGQEVSGLVFAVLSRPGFRITGVVTSSSGEPAREARINVGQEGMNGGSTFLSVALRPDGSFATGELAPGEYTVTARLLSRREELAAQRVVLENADAAVHLTLRRGDALRGRIQFDQGSDRASLQPSSVRLTVDGPGNDVLVLFGGLTLRDDWTFEGVGLSGPQRLSARLPRGWAIKSIKVLGRDVTDAPIEFGGADVEDIEVTLTQRVTTVSGLVRDDRGAPSLDATVVILADDPGKWTPKSRYVQRTRPDDEGRFVVQGLPAGRYVAVAVRDFDAGADTDPQALARLRPLGTRLSLNDGETHSVNLTVADGR
jgi:beta-lactamase regulating signal transducer with metallopeptidase domain